MRFRKSLALTLILSMLFALVGAVLPLGLASPSPVSYVALGDSIATGTVDYWSRITPYVDYFHDYLKGHYTDRQVTLTSFATDGDQSKHLLLKLNEDYDMITAVREADVITISIGGNNLMQAAAIPGFTEIDWELAEQGTKEFEEQWSQIVALLRELNDTAKIIALTVFNPYNQRPSISYSSDRGLHVATQAFLDRINGEIKENTHLGYVVADAHQAYLAYQPSSMGQVTYFYPPWYQYLLRNPHPKRLGQQIITDLHIEAFNSIPESPPADPQPDPPVPPPEPEPVLYTLSLEVNLAAGGSVQGGGHYAVDAIVEISATPNEGYSFVNWTIDNEEVSAVPTFHYTMPEHNVVLIANFEPIEEETPEIPTPIMQVTSITYTTNGPHLNVHITVLTEDGSAVANAVIEAELYHNDSKTPLVSFVVTTDANGQASYRYNRAPAGTYNTVITKVTAEGYEWDCETPDNNGRR